MVDVDTFLTHEGATQYALHFLGDRPPIIGLNRPDKYGNFPLMNAIKCCNEELAGLLLKRGADINAKNIAGETAMTFAAKRQDQSAALALVTFLLERGVDEEATKLGRGFLAKKEEQKKAEKEILELKERLQKAQVRVNETLTLERGLYKRVRDLGGEHVEEGTRLLHVRRRPLPEGYVNPHQERLDATLKRIPTVEERRIKEEEAVKQIEVEIDNRRKTLKQIEVEIDNLRKPQTGSKRKTSRRKRVRRSKSRKVRR
jgi:hypothetical protein